MSRSDENKTRRFGKFVDEREDPPKGTDPHWREYVNLVLKPGSVLAIILCLGGLGCVIWALWDVTKSEVVGEFEWRGVAVKGPVGLVVAGLGTVLLCRIGNIQIGRKASKKK